MQTKLSQLDTTIEIVTPENIAFTYRLAGPFRRWPAFMLDLGIRIGVFMAYALLMTFVTAMTGGVMAMPFAALMLISWFFMEWFYGGFFETYWNGQTPGKWVMGLRVVSIHGQPINGVQAIMRNFLRLVDMAPFLSIEMFGVPTPYYGFPIFLCGLVCMMLNRRYQRLGDLVCGTIVVIEEKRWLAGVAKLEDPRAAQLAEYLPADFVVSRSLARTLAMYADRRRYFLEARRREVARYLAEPLLAKFELPASTSHDLLLCALYYRTFIADRGDDSPFAARRESVKQQAASPFGNQSADKEVLEILK